MSEPTSRLTPFQVLRDRAVASWELARTSPLFLACLAALPVVIAMWLVGMPDWIVILASHAVLWTASVAFIEMAPRYRAWARTAPSLGLSRMQVGACIVAAIVLSVSALAILGVVAG